MEYIAGCPLFGRRHGIARVGSVHLGLQVLCDGSADRRRLVLEVRDQIFEVLRERVDLVRDAAVGETLQRVEILALGDGLELVQGGVDLAQGGDDPHVTAEIPEDRAPDGSIGALRLEILRRIRRKEVPDRRADRPEIGICVVLHEIGELAQPLCVQPGDRQLERLESRDDSRHESPPRWRPAPRRRPTGFPYRAGAAPEAASAAAAPTIRATSAAERPAACNRRAMASKLRSSPQSGIWPRSARWSRYVPRAASVRTR